MNDIDINMEIQFGERVSHGGWLIGPQIFRPKIFTLFLYIQPTLITTRRSAPTSPDALVLLAALLLLAKEPRVIDDKPSFTVLRQYLQIRGDKYTQWQIQNVFNNIWSMKLFRLVVKMVERTCHLLPSPLSSQPQDAVIQAGEGYSNVSQFLHRLNIADPKSSREKGSKRNHKKGKFSPCLEHYLRKLEKPPKNWFYKNYRGADRNFTKDISVFKQDFL